MLRCLNSARTGRSPTQLSSDNTGSLTASGTISPIADRPLVVTNEILTVEDSMRFIALLRRGANFYSSATVLEWP